MRNRTGRNLLLLLCFAMLASATGALSHPPFPAFVQRHTLISLSPDHIDLEIILLFHKDEARIIRRAIDMNRDGRLSPEEVERFRKHSETWKEQLPARVGETPIEWIPLHPALIDCFDEYVVNSSPIEIRLFFFTPLSEKVDTSVLYLEDTLFPYANALITWEIESQADVIAALRYTDGKTLESPHRLASPSVGGASRVIEIPFRIELTHSGGDE